MSRVERRKRHSQRFFNSFSPLEKKAFIKRSILCALVVVIFLFLFALILDNMRPIHECSITNQSKRFRSIDGTGYYDTEGKYCQKSHQSNKCVNAPMRITEDWGSTYTPLIGLLTPCNSSHYVQEYHCADRRIIDDDNNNNNDSDVGNDDKNKLNSRSNPIEQQMIGCPNRMVSLNDIAENLTEHPKHPIPSASALNMFFPYFGQFILSDMCAVALNRSSIAISKLDRHQSIIRVSRGEPERCAYSDHAIPEVREH